MAASDGQLSPPRQFPVRQPCGRLLPGSLLQVLEKAWLRVRLHGGPWALIAKEYRGTPMENTLLNRITIFTCISTILSLSVSSLAQVIDDPEVGLPGIQVRLLTSKEDFMKRFPAAKPFEIFPKPGPSKAKSFYVRDDAEPLCHVIFREEKVAVCKVAWSSLSAAQARSVAVDLMSRLAKLGGTSREERLGKMAGKGPMPITVLLFDLDNYQRGVSAVLEASSIEVAVQYVYTPLLPLEKLLETNRFLAKNAKKIPDGERDYLLEIIESGKAGVPPTHKQDQVTSLGSSKESTNMPESPMPRKVSWFVWAVLAGVAIGLLWMLLKRRS